jgi:putative SOS response-associated peptidase YedK
MCGRFNLDHLPGLQGLLEALDIDLELPRPRVNVAPTETVLLLRSGRGDPARWWLVPSWAKEMNTRYSLFNARAESLEKSPVFRGPFRRQRGIVPMSGFIEWRVERGRKQPWLIANDAKALAVAALWDVWEGGETPLLSCAVVTTEAAPALRPWHDRMPVLLTPAECRRWMNNEHPIDSKDPLFAPELKFALNLYPVPTAVGDARKKEPELFARPEFPDDTVRLT